MTGLFYAHSGLRYLVLLAGAVAVVYLAVALARRRPAARADRIVMAIYVGLLDLQVVLGLILVATGIFYGALMGHLVMMLAAAAVAHAAAAVARRGDAAPDPARNPNRIRVIGVLVSLGLVAGGIVAIGRSIFGSGAPSVTG